MFKTILHFVLEIINLPAVMRGLFRQRELIKTLTWRDFRARFRGSFGGILWALIQPLLMMVIYTLVFSTFLNVRFGNSDSPFTFAVFLLCGLLPWTAFSESFAASAALIRSNANLVKRVVFPLEVLPVNLSLASVIQQLVGFAMLLPLAYLVNQQLSWTLVFLPLILLLQILFMVGLSWIWASLSVFLPDLRQVTGLIVSALMFLTPLFYPRDILPDWAAPIATFNPLAQIIEMYRKIFLTGEIIPGEDWLLTGISCLVIFLLGNFWFMHTKKGFADVL